MSYAIYKRDEPFVLLNTGWSWAGVDSTHEKATPPYYHVPKLFRTKREAAQFARGRPDVRVGKWPADRETAQ